MLGSKEKGYKYIRGFLPLILALADYLAVVFSEFAAYFIRSNGFIGEEIVHVSPVYFFLIVPVVFLCFLHSAHTHVRNIPFWKLAQNISWAVVYSIVTIITLMYFGKVAEIVSRLYVGMTGSFALFFLLTERYFIYQIINRSTFFQVPTLFIGAGLTAELVLKSFGQNSEGSCKIVGFIDDHPVSSVIAENYPILGGFDDIEDVIEETGVDTVIITAPGLSPLEQVNLVNRIQPLVEYVSFVPDFRGAPASAIEVESLFDERIMLLRVRNNLAHWYNRLAKRIFDVILAIIGLVPTLAICLVIGVAIKLDSEGPVFYTHRRIGRNGKNFSCYKFRSMYQDSGKILNQYLRVHPDAKEEWEEFAKLRGKDPRVTKVGKWIRRYSLDELPQLFNVIKGDMSLVGPRPYLPRERKEMGEYLGIISIIEPGITGLWQTSGRNDVTFQNRLQMDAWYVRNWSIWMDFIFLVKTIKVVFSRKGAY